MGLSGPGQKLIRGPRGGHSYVFAAVFNSGDREVERVYEADGVLVAQPGNATRGTGRHKANAELMAPACPSKSPCGRST